MNVYDSERMAEKVYSELGRIRQHKEKHKPEMKVAVAGCVAQAEGEEILRRAPVVDMVLGPQTYHKLPEMIAKVHRGTGDVLETEFDTLEKFDQLPESAFTRQPRRQRDYVDWAECGCLFGRRP